MKAVRLTLIAAFALMGASAAEATPFYTFDFSYSDGGSNVGSSTITAYFNTGVTYVATDASGTANGQTIISLSGYDSPDDLVFYPAGRSVDSIGISFAVGDGSTSYQIYEDDGLYSPGSPYDCGGVYCLLGPGASSNLLDTSGDTVPIDFTLTLVSQTPLPAALPLFATGLSAIGLLGWRRKRKSFAAVAA